MTQKDKAKPDKLEKDHDYSRLEGSDPEPKAWEDFRRTVTKKPKPAHDEVVGVLDGLVKRAHAAGQRDHPEVVQAVDLLSRLRGEALAEESPEDK